MDIDEAGTGETRDTHPRKQGVFPREKMRTDGSKSRTEDAAQTPPWLRQSRRNAQEARRAEVAVA
ncbi:hypothetical protein HPB50_018624 [Hyalomma asiaticum]|uniref:Uncharacterized protein n=1 Tax=Hyalomma asiaticum TaxID=266040 RepID=A0ACB7T813_HYAAI|nr:hypothetical protein HPB50_018624 [Hyalomma asiaticum]